MDRASCTCAGILVCEPCRVWRRGQVLLSDGTIVAQQGRQPDLDTPRQTRQVPVRPAPRQYCVICQTPLHGKSIQRMCPGRCRRRWQVRQAREQRALARAEGRCGTCRQAPVMAGRQSCEPCLARRRKPQEVIQ